MAAMATLLGSPSCSSSSLCLPRSSFPTRLTTTFACSHKSSQPCRQSLRRVFSNRDNKDEMDEVSQKRFPGRGKDDRTYLPPDGSRGDGGRSQSSAFRSIGMQKREKSLSFDLKEQQVEETENLQDTTFLNAVVKVYCTHTEPDYSLPWQKQRQFTSTGSAFMIGDGKLLTNAHCVEHDTQVKVKRRGDDTKYVAKVLARGLECDNALLSVENKEFWKGAEPLRFGRLPCLQDSVTVIGYPLGGDTISVTKGVVSRIEVTSYAHGTSDLLGIQIDAAINPGNSGGPAFNDLGECIGVAFQKLENPTLRACLKVPSNEGVLVRRVEPTSPANDVLKEGDVIVNFDGVHVGSEGTVPFRSTERIAFRYLISQKFCGDVAELGIIRDGTYMKIQSVLQPRVHLVPYHIEGGQPSYLIVAGLVFTPLSEPLIEEECEDSIGLKLLAKARYSLARFKGEEIVILSQVLANEVNIGYEDMGNQQVIKFNGTPIKNIRHLAHLVDKLKLLAKARYSLARFKGEEIVILSQVLANEVNIGYEDMGNQQVIKFNGTPIKNIRHLAHLVDTCKDKYFVFEFEDKFLAVLEREAAVAASSFILKDYGIPCERSSDLLEPYVDVDDNKVPVQDIGDSPVSNLEFGFDGLLWA